MIHAPCLSLRQNSLFLHLLMHHMCSISISPISTVSGTSVRRVRTSIHNSSSQVRRVMAPLRLVRYFRVVLPSSLHHNDYILARHDALLNLHRLWFRKYFFVSFSFCSRIQDDGVNRSSYLFLLRHSEILMQYNFPYFSTFLKIFPILQIDPVT